MIASAGCLSGVCANVGAIATVSLVDDGGGPVSAEAYVRFTNDGDGTTATASGTGTINIADLGGGSSGDSVEGCVIAVTGRSLVGGYGGGSLCNSGAYP